MTSDVNKDLKLTGGTKPVLISGLESSPSISKKKILVICPNPEGVAPAQRLKYEQYFDHFRANGFQIVVSSFISDRLHQVVYKKGYLFQKCLGVLSGYTRRVFDLFRLPFYDGVYIFLWVTPFGTTFFERLYRLFSKKMIYDIDDLVYMGRTSAANKWIGFLKGKKKPFFLMASADHVITCTPHLDSIARKFTKKTTDISSTINTDVYIPKKTRSDKELLTLGWSGSVVTAPYLHLLDDVLRELKRRREFKILVIGEPSFKISGLDIEAIAWQEATEVRDLSRIDIGLYPLPDDPWVYGKSGLKALQYMALGIPPVATAIGANFRVIEDGQTGFLVKNDEEWIRRIEDLMDSSELRARLGKRAREKVESQFSVKANRPTYLRILENTYGTAMPSSAAH